MHQRDLPDDVELALQGLEEAVPEAHVRPSTEARGHRGPRAVALGQISPPDPGRVSVEHAVEDAAAILTIRAGCFARLQQRRDPRPFGGRERMTTGHTPPRQVTTRRAPQPADHPLSPRA